MIIEETENADLYFEDENYQQLKTGLAIFPETLKDIEKLKTITEYIKILCT